MEQTLAGFGLVVLFVLLVCAMFSFGAWLLMLLWNWVLVGLFHFPVLTFGYAIGIILLLMLVGSFTRSRVVAKD